MKILVCISNVPDTTTKVKFAENNTKFDPAGVQWVINPWDELALTRALELKDNASAGVKSVSVAHVGPATAEPTIRKALAIGADDAIRVNLEATDAYQVAAQLAEVVKTEQYDIVLCGIESSDFNGSTVGSMIAEFIGCPSVSAVSGLNFENGQSVITREIDGGKETENRRYIILINSRQNKLKAPLLRDIPFEARVGIIGHELAHIVDYNRKSFIQIIGNGIAYITSNKFKRNLEHKIDRIAINKGLGEGLYQFRLFVEEEANTTEKYRRFKDNIYLSSTDISNLVKSINNLAIEE
ncbi:MAG: hypothetical protein PHW91_03960 [Bacteroidales bacterium]|nr:hypothetical protein [Bacteroidales bacterium]